MTPVPSTLRRVISLIGIGDAPPGQFHSNEMTPQCPSQSRSPTNLREHLIDLWGRSARGPVPERWKSIALDPSRTSETSPMLLG